MTRNPQGHPPFALVRARAGGVYQHVRNGERYVVIGFGMIERDAVPAVLYAPHRIDLPLRVRFALKLALTLMNYALRFLAVTVWVRPTAEFSDGRFREVQ